jgi:hypothetical protein
METLPFTLETDLERAIAAAPEWQAGVAWGTPRPGHAEGQVMYHIADVLANVERHATSAEERRTLRLIALVHDAFKYEVDWSQPRTGANHHAMRARHFAARYIEDAAALDVIELHDVVINAWRQAHHSGDWAHAEARLDRLLTRLGDTWPLYLRFFRSDSQTASKIREPGEWFEASLARRGYDVPPDPGPG